MNLSLEKLITRSTELLNNVKDHCYIRTDLFSQLEPSEDKIILLHGATSAGKTTLLQQFLNHQQEANKQVLYLTCSELINKFDLPKLAMAYQEQNGEYLAIDDIHFYYQWQELITTVLKTCPKLKLLLAGSIIPELAYLTDNLRNRLMPLQINPLSFREYIAHTYQVTLPKFSFNDFLHDSKIINQTIRQELAKQLNLTQTPAEEAIIILFQNYLKHGYLFNQQNILNATNRTIDLILPHAHPELTSLEKNKLKLLFNHLSDQCPFTPNILDLSKSLNLKDENLLKKYLFYLTEAEIITCFYHPQQKTLSPQKIFLANPGLIYALNQPNKFSILNIYMTYVANTLQLVPYCSKEISLTSPETNSFCLDNYYFQLIINKNTNHLAVGYLVEKQLNLSLSIWLLGFI